VGSGFADSIIHIVDNVLAQEGVRQMDLWGQGTVVADRRGDRLANRP
jgi:hypothetical protein